MDTISLGGVSRLLDVARLLASETGLITSLQLLPPSDDQPWWRAAGLLDCEHAAEDQAAGYSRCSTGACAMTRTDALVRTAGEAVERIAMHGEAEVVAPVTALEGRVMPYWQSGWSLGGDPAGQELGWVTATRLRDDTECWVPVGLVNYPYEISHELFDPHPSGAAAGLGRERTLKAALLETIERDALISAWTRRQHLGHVDLAEVLRTATPPAARALEAAHAAARHAAGAEPIFARIPLGVPGLHCVVAGTRPTGPAGPFVCLGAKVSEDPAQALTGALVESLQLLSALPLLPPATSPPVPAVTSELERIEALASPAGVASLEGWLADPVPMEPLERAGQLSTEELTTTLISDGLDPYVVDLTPRLPEAVRRMGWVVLKVIPGGYQPLRIDERTTFGWNQQRLDSVEARTGVACRQPAGTRYAAPHPLP